MVTVIRRAWVFISAVVLGLAGFAAVSVGAAQSTAAAAFPGFSLAIDGAALSWGQRFGWMGAGLAIVIAAGLLGIAALHQARGPATFTLDSPGDSPAGQLTVSRRGLTRLVAGAASSVQGVRDLVVTKLALQEKRWRVGCAVVLSAGTNAKAALEALQRQVTQLLADQTGFEVASVDVSSTVLVNEGKRVH